MMTQSEPVVDDLWPGATFLSCGVLRAILNLPTTENEWGVVHAIHRIVNGGGGARIFVRCRGDDFERSISFTSNMTWDSERDTIEYHLKTTMDFLMECGFQGDEC